MLAKQSPNTEWHRIGKLEDLIPNSGVCALVYHHQVAIFLIQQRQQSHLFAISNFDPFGQANVLYRGIIGSQNEEWYVASPLLKQRFCLRTGQCLDDSNVSIDTFPVIQHDDEVFVEVAQSS